MRGRHDEALAPDLVAARVNRAVLHYEAGRFEAALTDMDRAIALEPQQPEHYLNRAEIHKAMARRDLYQHDPAAAAACREAA
jgi:tetratricopeptide (TPR) repeat protein